MELGAIIADDYKNVDQNELKKLKSVLQKEMTVYEKELAKFNKKHSDDLKENKKKQKKILKIAEKILNQEEGNGDINVKSSTKKNPRMSRASS